MAWSIAFYGSVVESSIRDMPEAFVANYLRLADAMLEFGPNLGMPHTRAIGGGLFELRLRGREGIGRVFYCTAAGRRIVMLYSFIKKTEQTPLHDLRIARTRLLEVRKS